MALIKRCSSLQKRYGGSDVINYSTKINNHKWTAYFWYFQGMASAQEITATAIKLQPPNSHQLMYSTNEEMNNMENPL